MRLWPVHERRFPVWMCALFFLGAMIQPFYVGIAAGTPKKIEVESRPDTGLEKDGQSVPLQNPPLFLDDRFYLSVKQIDDLFGTSTIWNKKRNVLEMTRKTAAPGTTATPNPATSKATAKPGSGATGQTAKATAKATPFNLNKKATPTPRNFKSPAPSSGAAKVTATPVGFLFSTPTPTPRTFNQNNSGSTGDNSGNNAGNTANGTNGNGNGSGTAAAGGNSGNNANGMTNGKTNSPVPTSTPPAYLLRGSPTAKPTPVKSLMPTPSPTPDPIEFTRLINYTAKYLDVNYELGGALYKDVMYFRFRDVALMNVDWTGVKIYKDKRTEETFIMLEDFRSRLAQIPVMGMYDQPIVRGESDPDKIKAILQTLTIFSSASNPSKTFWITATSKTDEFRSISQNEMDGALSESTITVQKNASGYSATISGFKMMK